MYQSVMPLPVSCIGCEHASRPTGLLLNGQTSLTGLTLAYLAEDIAWRKAQRRIACAHFKVAIAVAQAIPVV